MGDFLQTTYPREVIHEDTMLGRESLTSFAGPVTEFVTGVMPLAGLILLAACANLGSLFAARASDCSREDPGDGQHRAHHSQHTKSHGYPPLVYGAATVRRLEIPGLVTKGRATCPINRLIVHT